MWGVAGHRVGGSRALHGAAKHCTVLLCAARCCRALRRAAGHCTVLLGTARHCQALRGAAKRCMVLLCAAWCCWALHCAAGHCAVLPGIERCHLAWCGTGLGIARCRRALHGATVCCTVPPCIARCRWATRESEPGVARCRQTFQGATGHGTGRERAMPSRPRLSSPSPVRVPMPAARRSPAAGSAGFAVSGALFSVREALAQQMAGITKQLAAAKPIIYLIMIYHLTT